MIVLWEKTFSKHYVIKFLMVTETMWLILMAPLIPQCSAVCCMQCNLEFITRKDSRHRLIAILERIELGGRSTNTGVISDH